MKDQKDRLGDKLRKREKADEDRYFAEQDREKLERMKEDDQTPLPEGLCPRGCGELTHKDIENVPVDICVV